MSMFHLAGRNPDKFQAHTTHCFLHLFCVTVELEQDVVPADSFYETRAFLVQAEDFRAARDMTIPLVDSWKNEKERRTGILWRVSDVLTELYEDRTDTPGPLKVLKIDQATFAEDRRDQ